MLLINPQGIPSLGAPVKLNDAAVASGQAFVTGELEKLNPKIYDPLTSVTWPRDIVVKTGGGFVDNTSNFFADYATPGANEFGLMAGATTVLPTIQANLSKDLFPVNNFGYVLKVPFFDQARMAQVGRSLEALLTTGLRLNYDKMLDYNAYLGMSRLGQTGLLNNPHVPHTLAALNQAGTSRKWRQKTPDEILADVNTALNSAWEASEYDITGMPNHIMLPPADFTYIATTKVSQYADKTILTFLLENNAAKEQGVNLVIVPSRWCIDAGDPVLSGTQSSGRMICYVNDEDRVCFDETVSLQRVLTQPSVNDMAYLSGYIAKVGVVKFLYFQCVIYVDGIS